MPILSSYARSRKLHFFTPHLPEDAAILEVGSGDGWLGEHLRAQGWSGYRNVDLSGPADFVGDINRWTEIGIEPESFDVLIAFEVVEHGDFYDAFHAILRPGGLLFLTTPCPNADWFLKLLETAAEELTLIRDVLDPDGRAEQEVPS